MVGAGAENRRRDQLAHHKNSGHDNHNEDYNFALVFGKGKVILQMNLLMSGIHTQNNHKD